MSEICSQFCPPQQDKIDKPKRSYIIILFFFFFYRKACQPETDKKTKRYPRVEKSTQRVLLTNCCNCKETNTKLQGRGVERYSPIVAVVVSAAFSNMSSPSQHLPNHSPLTTCKYKPSLKAEFPFFQIYKKGKLSLK